MAPNSLDRVSLTRDEPVNAQGSAPYFNRVSSDYFKRYTEHSPGGYAFRVRKQRLLELLDGERGRVLDIGCGPGVLVPEMLSRGFEFWGVDAAPNMIEECCKSFGDRARAHFSVGNATGLEFSPESFDVVISAGVIDHIRDYERAIGEMLRVLRKDGTLIVAFPNLFSPSAWWRNFVFYPVLRVLRPLYFGLLGRPQPPALSSCATMHSQRGVRKLIERNGGELCKVAYYNFNPLLSPLDEIFPRATVKLTKRLEQLSTGWLMWLGCGFLVKVKKRSSMQ
jgi:ubiquinone/menaquinone biosynthesis C-methylase UbiE